MLSLHLLENMGKNILLFSKIFPLFIKWLSYIDNEILIFQKVYIQYLI